MITQLISSASLLPERSTVMHEECVPVTVHDRTLLQDKRTHWIPFACWQSIAVLVTILVCILVHFKNSIVVDHSIAGLSRTGGNYSTVRRKLIQFNHTTPIDKDTKITPNVDLSSSNPIALIKCANQTRCIQPVLQLRKSYKVYYCNKIAHGVRFYYLVKEGLLHHPKINFVSNPEVAEVVVYLPGSAPWHKSECNRPELYSKLLILDEGDGPQLFDPKELKDWLLMFKRSYVRRHNGNFKSYMGYISKINVHPMTYTIADAYVSNTFNRQANRDIEILCTLRPSKEDSARARVHQWVAEYGKARGIKGMQGDPVNHDSRTVISKGYFGSMQRSQIIVTANPTGWEGDFRLCESIASGALVFVDKMYVPRPNPFEHDKHYVVYDSTNKTDLFEKLDFYRNDKQLARRVAINGYIHAMRHHRAANLIDYFFRTLHLKEILIEEAKFDLLPSVGSKAQGIIPSIATLSHGYTETGFHMRIRALEWKPGQPPP